MPQSEKSPEHILHDVQSIIYENKTVQSVVTDGVRYAEQAMPRFLQDLQRLCLTESPSDDPPGLNAMAEQLAVLLQHVGMETTIVEHALGNAVMGTINGENLDAPTCLLLGHHDTVHPVGVAQARMRLEADRFYGPGAADMKAGLLQGIYALEILKRNGYDNFHKLIFLSVPDEEISTRYHASLIRQIAQEERPVVLGLEGAHSIGNVVIKRKGCAHYRLTAEGVAAHAGSSIEQGRNAVLELAHQIVQAQQLMGWREGLTINAGPIRGGSRANIVSDFAEIVFDLRFLRPEDRLAAEAHWHKLLLNQFVPDVKLSLRAEPDSMQPMVATSESLNMAYHARWIAEHILETAYEPEVRGGASDCCTTATAGCASIDGLGAIGKGVHTAEEYVLVPPIPARIALLAGLIVAVTGDRTNQSP